MMAIELVLTKGGELEIGLMSCCEVQGVWTGKGELCKPFSARTSWTGKVLTRY
jgi:hypothetical protein